MKVYVITKHSRTYLSKEFIEKSEVVVALKTKKEAISVCDGEISDGNGCVYWFTYNVVDLVEDFPQSLYNNI